MGLWSSLGHPLHLPVHFLTGENTVCSLSCLNPSSPFYSSAFCIPHTSSIGDLGLGLLAMIRSHDLSYQNKNTETTELV